MDSTRKRWLSPVFRQVWVVLSVYSNLIGQGMMFGMTSTMISTMLAPEADFRIDVEVVSWFGAILPGSGLLLLPLTSYLMNKIGRRVTYILMNMPAVVGLVIDACAYDVTTLLLGRVLCGFASGSTSILGLMVIGEVTSPDFRAIFLMLKTFFFNLGILLAHFISYYFHWRTVTFVTAAPFVISIIIAFTWPESPYWLAENKKFKESEKSFYWLRGKTRDSTREFDEIIRNQHNREVKKTFSKNFKEFVLKFRKKNFWKPFVIVVVATLMGECGGRHAFQAYAGLIIRNMMSSSKNSIYFNMAMDIIITMSALSSSYLVKISKLRTLLFTTGSISVVMLYLTSLSMFLVSNGTLSNEYSMIPICLLGLFFVVVNLSCTLMPLTIGGEIFPIEHRAVGVCVVGYIKCTFQSIMLKITPQLIENFKIHGTFTFLASGLLFALLGLFFTLPETKNKTLQEIDDFFTYGKRRKVRDYDEDDKVDRTIATTSVANRVLIDQVDHCNTAHVTDDSTVSVRAQL